MNSDHYRSDPVQVRSTASSGAYDMCNHIIEIIERFIAFVLLPQRVGHCLQGAMQEQHCNNMLGKPNIHCPQPNIEGDKQTSGWKYISCHTDKNRYYTWS